MLKIEDLRAYYDSIPALKGISIEVAKGKVVSIIGANGAGKSTMLKSVAGLLATQEGRILFKDRDIAGMAANKIVALGISLVPEGRQIFGHLKVLDNINLGAYLYYKRRHRSEIEERIERVYSLFPILKKRSKQLDEPSMGLAPLVVREIFSVIEQLNESGTTILLVEQNAKAALNVAQHACVLETGEIVLEGLAGELLDNPKVKQAYLGG
jgi:branched-chain amino acid transport system ATP-binding protein